MITRMDLFRSPRVARGLNLPASWNTGPGTGGALLPAASEAGDQSVLPQPGGAASRRPIFRRRPLSPPPSITGAWWKCALLRHIHVMMEKPLAVNLDHARAIAAAAKSGGIQVIVNYETTWYPGNQAAYRIVNEGHEIGELRKIVVQRRAPRAKGK